MGAKREEIELDSALKNLIYFDDQEWLCFLFFLESKFNLSLTEQDERKLQTVESTINTVQLKLNMEATSYNQVEQREYAFA